MDGNSLRDTMKDVLRDYLSEAKIRNMCVDEIVCELADRVFMTLNIDCPMQDMKFDTYQRIMDSKTGISKITYLLNQIKEVVKENSEKKINRSHEVGACAKCSSNGITYNNVRPDGEFMCYEYVCGCGFEGEERFKLNFVVNTNKGGRP